VPAGEDLIAEWLYGALVEVADSVGEQRGSRAPDPPQLATSRSDGIANGT
jgi:hypothetical protein